MRDLIAGLLLTGFALLFLIPGLHYGFGTLQRLDTGGFPIILSVLLILMALVIGAGGLTNWRDNAISIKLEFLRPILFVAAAVISFALTIERFGLIPATALSILITTFAEKRTGFSKVLLLILVGCILVWLIFKLGLNLPIAAFKVKI